MLLLRSWCEHSISPEITSSPACSISFCNSIQSLIQPCLTFHSLCLSLSVSVEVNVSRSQLLFSSLVCIDVQEDQLISQVLQHRLPLPPPLPSNINKAADGPSPLLFMTSEHIRQKPVTLEDEPDDYKPRQSARPAYSTFDLYRRGRCWEVMPWHTHTHTQESFFWSDCVGCHWI